MRTSFGFKDYLLYYGSIEDSITRALRPGVFGAAGAGGSLVISDPARGLTVAITANKLDVQVRDFPSISYLFVILPFRMTHDIPLQRDGPARIAEYIFNYFGVGKFMGDV